MDIKSILKKYNVDVENVEDLVDAIKGEIHTDFIPKKQYSKKVNQLDTLQEKLDELEAKSKQPNDLEEKYNALKSKYEDFKNNIETEKINATKKSVLTKALEKEGFNKKIINLLEKDFNLDSIEVEEDNIKEWDKLIEPYKEQYKDFISTEQLEGTGSATPPSVIERSSFTKEDINNMTTEEINKNWDMISKSLTEI